MNHGNRLCAGRLTKQMRAEYSPITSDRPIAKMHGYDLHGAPPPPHDLGPPPSDMAHPDSTDSYVTYLESDDSLHHDTFCPLLPLAGRACLQQMAAASYVTQAAAAAAMCIKQEKL
ncbi:hypothetical protein C0J52_00435 [Blattella germanica]|nr:hypothetical protein C0J52_00435 [Blattella germanica]